jgi:hypothetical protein
MQSLTFNPALACISLDLPSGAQYMVENPDHGLTGAIGLKSISAALDSGNWVKIAVDMAARHATTDPIDHDPSVQESGYAKPRLADGKKPDVPFQLLTPGGLFQSMLPGPEPGVDPL